MAKQRPQPKPKDKSPAVQVSKATPVQAAHPVSTGPLRRSTYVDAVALYERGLESLQRHEYDEALQVLRSVITRFPEEKELHERVRLYLNVCERHATPPAATPRSIQERLYASTLSINGGNYDEAISHLRLVRDEDPDNDHALYMLAVAHAQRGEHAEAIAHLERSITLNAENRALARRDPDLDPLRGDDAFRLALDNRLSHDPDDFERRAQRHRTAR